MRKLISIVCLFVLIGMVGGCAKEEKPANAYLIETPHGVLEYPLEYKEDVRTRQITQGDTHTVQFLTDVGQQEILLFAIVFGGEAGMRLGAVGGTAVFLQQPDLQLPDGIDRDTEDHIYALQEAVNKVIDSLTAREDFRKE